MEGMGIRRHHKRGKVLNAVVELLDQMADSVVQIDETLDQLYDEVDALSEEFEDGGPAFMAMKMTMKTRTITTKNMRRACMRLLVPTVAKWSA